MAACRKRFIACGKLFYFITKLTCTHFAVSHFQIAPLPLDFDFAAALRTAVFYKDKNIAFNRPLQLRNSQHRSVSALRRKLRSVGNFFASKPNPLRWASVWGRRRLDAAAVSLRAMVEKRTSVRMSFFIYFGSNSTEISPLLAVTESVLLPCSLEAGRLLSPFLMLLSMEYSS